MDSTVKPIDKVAINRFHSLGNAIPQITDPGILRSHSLGTPIERVLEDEDNLEEEEPILPPSEEINPEKKEKKEKKDKKREKEREENEGENVSS